MGNSEHLSSPYSYALEQKPCGTEVHVRAHATATECDLDQEASRRALTDSAQKCDLGGEECDLDDEDLRRALIDSAEIFQSLEEERASARERLMCAASLHRAQVIPVQADGNCQFRALSFALYGTEDSHGELRVKVVEQLKTMENEYAQFVHEAYGDYLQRMARDGEWGDNVTLQAASDAMGCRIQVLTDEPDGQCLMINPKQLRLPTLLQQPLWSLPKPVCLAFVTERHYDAAVIPDLVV